MLKCIGCLSEQKNVKVHWMFVLGSFLSSGGRRCIAWCVYTSDHLIISPFDRLFVKLFVMGDSPKKNETVQM